MADRRERDWLDAALHLLDRQVLDSDGLNVCKVDDLEITFDADGRPAVTRILTGPAALVPRLSSHSGHGLRARWISLGIQYADRDVPLAVPLHVIEHVGSGIELGVPRAGLLDRQPAPAGVERRRMGELLGARVHSDHDELRGKVLDVRLRPGDDALPMTHLVVGPGRPGSLLGYDRGDFNGPWLVSSVVRFLHRHIRLVPWSAVEEIDWDRGTVRVRADAEVTDVSASEPS